MNPTLRPLCLPLLTLTLFGGASVASSRADDAPAGQRESASEQDAPAKTEGTEAQPEAAEPAPDTKAEDQAADSDGDAEPAAADESEAAPEADHEDDGNDGGSGDPEMDRLHQSDQEFEKTTADLAEKHRSASTPDDREAARSELLEAVNRHFDLRQEIRARELAELEKQIAELRKSLDRRTELREKIVQRRMTELLGDETEDLDF